MDAAADTDALAEFNRLPAAAAAACMRRCCGSDVWARRMVDGRPYDSRAELLDAADRHWLALPAAAQLQAFEAHPAIGGDATTTESREEQAGVAGASAATRAELARLNRDYRRKFGFVFLICASGLSADFMRDQLRARIDNSPAQERANAAEEQRKITRLRLQKMFAAESVTVMTTVESTAAEPASA